MDLEAWLNRRLISLRDKNLFRVLPTSLADHVVDFSSNDYLGLSKNSILKTAAVNAINQYGTGTGSSRLISGTTVLHEALEKRLAGWYGKEQALLFNSGYHTGVGVIPAISGEGVIFSDELNHASLIDGCRLSRADVVVYRHRDMNHLESLLKAHQGSFPRWILSESIFSMEGTMAPLPDLVALKRQYGAALFLDEAHAIGLYGKHGKGVAEEYDVLPQVDLIMGTFSKALGSFGGFVTGSKMMISFIINAARSFIFSTALPAPVASVNLESIDLASRMYQERIALRQAAEEARSFFLTFDLKVLGGDSPIIPIVLGSPDRALELSKVFLHEGLWIKAIRPPTVPEGTSRLRISLSAFHTKEDFEKLSRAFRKNLAFVS